MIYTLISDLSLSQNGSNKCEGADLTTDKTDNSAVSCSIKEILDEKRDCRILRQPLSLLPEEIKKFIENTKNDMTRSERRLAYTTLLCGVKAFFDIENCTVAKAPDGKPYLIRVDKPSAQKTSVEKSYSQSDKKKYQKNEDLNNEECQHQKNIDLPLGDAMQNIEYKSQPELYISISHSDGVIAACISDEGEIGVDIQREIAEDRAERLNARFLNGLNIVNDRLNVKYYYCDLYEDEARLYQINPYDLSREDFTSKWAYSESIMKLYGRGFKDIQRLNELSLTCRTEIKEYRSFHRFVISTSSQK